MSLLTRVGRFIDDVLLLPDELRHKLEIADGYLSQELFADAADLYRDILEARPTLVRASVGLSDALESLGDSAGAVSVLERAAESAPDDARLALSLSEAALEDGQFELASSAAMRASRSFKSGEPLFLSRLLGARAERARDRPDRAAREFRKALAVFDSDRSEPGISESRMPVAIELLECLVEAEQPSAAVALAETLKGRVRTSGESASIGVALIRAGAGNAASSFLEDASDNAHARTLLAIGALAEARESNDPALFSRAADMARQSLSLGGGRESLRLLADALFLMGQRLEAVEALGASLADDSLEERRLALAEAWALVPLTDRASLTALRNAIPDAAEEEWSILQAFYGETTLVPRVLEESTRPRAWLALAHQLARTAKGAEQAIELLDRWGGDPLRAEVDRELADDIRQTALFSSFHTPQGDLDLPAAIDTVSRFASAHHLVDMERRAKELRDDLDRPLLIAVMGEFNAGKSTFINAFVGAKVAPMGIVPTTSTLNVLRAGAERLVRVVRRDGSTREGDFGMAERLLNEANDDAGVDRVEIVVPSELLERVWILDTPGTNAPDPDHERLSREAADRADVVLWVFDAGQAGKSTEKAVLNRLTESGRPVLFVLNKADRLKPGELERVTRVLAEEFPGSRAVPMSAKRALAARLSEDEAGLKASGFTELMDRLDKEVFQCARALKRTSSEQRLLAAVTDALANEDAVLSHVREQRGSLLESAPDVSKLRAELSMDIDDRVRDFVNEVESAYENASVEVLAFVRPRQRFFQGQVADPEDRAFLAETLEREFFRVADQFLIRLLAQVRSRLGPLTRDANVPRELLLARVEAALSPELALYLGLWRGSLRTGTLETFFGEFLPGAGLDEAGPNEEVDSAASVRAISEALRRGRPDAQTELRPGLREKGFGLVTWLDDLRRRRLTQLEVEEKATRASVFGPLRSLSDALSRVR